MPASKFEKLVRAELARARDGHPPMASHHEAYGVILEEVDEFWDEVKLKAKDRVPEKTLAELVQIASSCRKAAEDLGLV